jgi:ABC-type glycerol-3-phosphate transport system permease component
MITAARLKKDIAKTIIHLLLIAAVFVAMFLLFWLISIAVRPVEETYKVAASLLPKKLTINNFHQVLFELPQMAIYYRNSLIITFIAVGSIVIISALAGYAFARVKFPGRNLIFWAVIATIFFPYTISLPALYDILYRLHLTDSLIGLILPYTAIWLRLGTLIMRQVFLSVPKELDDAATIDGCSRLGAFWRVLLPITSSGWVVVAIFAFVPMWGAFMLAFTVTSTPRSMPISIGMKMLEPNPAFAEWTFPVAAAAALMIFIPSLIIFIVFQKWFTRGITAGALKF